MSKQNGAPANSGTQNHPLELSNQPFIKDFTFYKSRFTKQQKTTKQTL
jgi:hypothetical protein